MHGVTTQKTSTCTELHTYIAINYDNLSKIENVLKVTLIQYIYIYVCVCVFTT